MNCCITLLPLVPICDTDERQTSPPGSAVYTDKPGQPTRLMAGLAILKHSYDLSDEPL
jgi:hypothetical protein